MTDTVAVPILCKIIFSLQEFQHWESGSSVHNHRNTLAKNKLFYFFFKAVNDSDYAILQNTSSYTVLGAGDSLINISVK